MSNEKVASNPMESRDYIKSIYQKHKEEFPYITTTHLKCFTAKIPSLKVVNHRDLKFVRRLFFKECSNITDEDRVLVDVCFPADLGPFASQICSTLLPKANTVNRRRNVATTKSEEETTLPSRLEQQQLICGDASNKIDDLQVLNEKMPALSLVAEVAIKPQTRLPLTTSEETLIDEDDAEEILAKEIVGKEMKLSIEMLLREMRDEEGALAFDVTSH